MRREPRPSLRKPEHLLKAKGIMTGIKLHQGPLPPGYCGGRDLGEGGEKEAWIYVALDPRTLLCEGRGQHQSLLGASGAVAEARDHRWRSVVGGLLPTKLGQLEEVALDLRLAPQPHRGRMLLTGPRFARSRGAIFCCNLMFKGVLWRGSSIRPLRNRTFGG